MRILLLNDKRNERDAIVKALPRSSYQIEVAADERAAVDFISRQSPEVVIFSALAKGTDDFARRLRSVDKAQAYFIAILDSNVGQKDLGAMLSVGVNDFVRRPVVDAEILERVKAPARHLRWAKSLTRPAAFDLSVGVDMGRIQAWQALGTTVADDLGQVAGQPFVVADGWPRRFPEVTRAASIPMSLAGDQLEVRVSIAVDTTTASWIRATLLGDPSADAAAVDDVLRELANTSGGALKRSALSENIALTTGIPVNEQLKVKDSPNCKCWTLSIEGTDATIAVIGEVLAKENKRVAASQLCEGMIIAYDVHSEAGVLLVPAGSRLTSTTAAKLGKILGQRFLEVAPAA